jgi:hypothetical protein
LVLGFFFGTKKKFVGELWKDFFFFFAEKMGFEVEAEGMG